MITNLQSDYEYYKEPSLNQVLSSQEVFERVMANELPIFAEILEKALEMTLADLQGKHPSFQNRNSKANRMNENIRGLLFEHFPDEMHEDRHRRYFFKKDSKYIILFKKFNKKLKPMNIETKNSKDILKQCSLEFPDKVPLIFVGYTMNRSCDSIEELCAVYISNGQTIWITDLRRFNRGLSSFDIFGNSPDDDKPLDVQPKQKISNAEQEEDQLLVVPKQKKSGDEQTATS